MSLTDDRVPTRVARVRTFLRLRVVGETGSVDVIAPDDVELSELLHQVTDQLHAPVDHYRLDRLDGRVVTGPVPLRAHGIADGTTLYLRRDSDPLAGAGTVHDVAERIAVDTDERPGWGPRAGAVAGGASLAMATTGLAIGAAVGDLSAAWVIALVGLGSLIAIAAAAGHSTWPSSVDRAGPVESVLAAAPGGGVLAGVSAVQSTHASAFWLPLASVCGALVGIAAGSGVSRWLRARLHGIRTAGAVLAAAGFLYAVAGIVLAGGPQLGESAAASVVALLSAASLSVPPSWALAISGIATIADATGEHPVRRSEIDHRLASARTDLLAMRAALALVVAVTAVDLARAGGAALGMSVALTVLLALRARTVGDVGGRAVSIGAAALAFTGSVTVIDPGTGDFAVLGLYVLCGLSLVRAPGRITRGRVRIALGYCETVVLVSLVPVMLAVCGIYSWAWAAVR